MVMFQKAVKFESKGRVALVGPAGSGKSYTMLTFARELANGGKIAAVDTEHGSLSKYADLFDFDVVELDSFSPDNFMKALAAAEGAGYAVFCCDSLSHFWMGKDGALEFVDAAGKRYKDNMGGWKEFRPHERQMVDAMIASPCHVICTMRTKTDYQEVTENGKKKRVKIGLAPVQRDGMEYEFDLVGYMDDENTLIVDKTRCSAFSGKAFSKPGAKEAKIFATWLHGAARVDRAATPPPETKPQLVARRIAEESGEPPANAEALEAATATATQWKNRADQINMFKAFKEITPKLGGDDEYRRMLKVFGYASSKEIPDKETGTKVYRAMARRVEELLDAGPQMNLTYGEDVHTVSRRAWDEWTAAHRDAVITREMTAEESLERFLISVGAINGAT